MGKDLKGRELGPGLNQEASGMYRWRYTAPDGSRQTVILRSLALLREQKKLVEAEITKGTWVDPRRSEITLDEWFAQWIERHSGADSTRSAYVERYVNHVQPYLGSFRLRDLSPTRIEWWLTDHKRDGRSAAMRKKGHKALSAMLQAAVDDERMPGNPCLTKRGSCPNPPKRDWRKVDEDGFDCLHEALPERDRGMAIIMWTMALRFGEVAALRRMDVDVLHRKLHIERGTYYVRKQADYNIAGGRRTKTPKSGRSRTIPWIPERALRVLERQLELPGAPDAPLFPAPKGGIHFHHAWLQRSFTPAVQKAGLAPLTPHDLRHSAASWLSAKGLSIDLLQQVLGHSSRRTTELYIHVTLDEVRNGLKKAWGEDEAVPATRHLTVVRKD